MNKVKVALVGAGPGDAGLLTLKAKERIENADIILHDRLINKDVLGYAKKDAIIIDVGKDNTDEGKLQDSINKMIIDYSKKYNNIVRLKGGDPFLFGRGGEEAEILKENNIEFEIIPGVTSAISVPAYAGIPVTHRSYSSELHIFTGHSKVDSKDLDFKKIANLDGTLVFLMGIKNIFHIINELLINGKNPDTPIAVIENGTTSKQKILISTLNEIKNTLKTNKINPPSIIVIGEAVSLNKKLDWFTKKILFGKKILVTREIKESNELPGKLNLHGADVMELPFIKIVDQGEKKMDKNFIKKLKDYSTILFCSVNGVKFFFNRLNVLNIDSRILGGIKIGVVGEGTQNELNKFYIIPDFMPVEYTVEKLIEKAVKENHVSKKILIITSNLSPVDANSLKNKYNITFDKLELYNTVENKITKRDMDCISKENIDLVTFCSSSTVKSFFKKIKKPDKKIKIASIGPVTSETIKSYGYNVDIEAKKYCIDGLAEAIIKYYEI